MAPGQQLTHPHFVPDASLHQQPPLTYSPNESFHNGPGMSMDMSGHFDALNAGDGSFDMSMEAAMQEDAAGDGTKRKKGSASSQANDVELRRLFRENKHKSLKDVATQVLKDEKGPKSEKTKQIFGMIW